MNIVTQDGVPVTTSVLYYGTIANGNYYFSKRLNSDAWNDASDSDKEKALIQATRAIDRLFFSGCKYDTNQILEFPRNDDTVVPSNINIATYEEALVLLDGADPQMEFEKLGDLSHSFASVRTTYDRSVISENVRAGIMSIIAWNYLLPYLHDSREITISRV